MNFSSKLMIVCILSILVNDKVSAQGLSIEGTFTGKEILGEKEVKGIKKSRDFISKVWLQKWQEIHGVKEQYRLTGDKKYLKQIKSIQQHMDSLTPILKEFDNITERPIRVRLVAGSGGKYDKLPQMRSNESVAEYLKKRPNLLGTGKTIVINAPHLASGSSKAKLSKKKKKKRRSNRSKSNRSKSNSSIKPSYTSNPNVRKSKLTPGKGGGLLGTGL